MSVIYLYQRWTVLDGHLFLFDHYLHNSSVMTKAYIIYVYTTDQSAYISNTITTVIH